MRSMPVGTFRPFPALPYLLCEGGKKWESGGRVKKGLGPTNLKPDVWDYKSLVGGIGWQSNFGRHWGRCFVIHPGLRGNCRSTGSRVHWGTTNPLVPRGKKVGRWCFFKPFGQRRPLVPARGGNWLRLDGLRALGRLQTSRGVVFSNPRGKEGR